VFIEPLPSNESIRNNIMKYFSLKLMHLIMRFIVNIVLLFVCDENTDLSFIKLAEFTTCV
jgi:hypothetical protein